MRRAELSRRKWLGGTTGRDGCRPLWHLAVRTAQAGRGIPATPPAD